MNGKLKREIMKVGIFVLNEGAELTKTGNDIYPELFIIGTYVQDHLNHSFVGHIVVNSIENEYCESIIYSGNEGHMIQ